MAAFLLLGGSLGDRLGRRKVYLTGIVWFAVASAACGLAPNAGFLIITRALQGIGAALLTPGSLAILEASFIPAADRRLPDLGRVLAVDLLHQRGELASLYIDSFERVWESASRPRKARTCGSQNRLL